MRLLTLSEPLSVYQVHDLSHIDLKQKPLFISQTEDELSIVSASKTVPKDTLKREDEWRALKIEGVLDFSLVGILATISSLLAAKNISIFAISTYNTDYILVKADTLVEAINILEANDYTVEK
ncbi:ACT domain-containing protein [Enterococcus hermanniensis]|nr:ACT domain-containing protein [Enterococcus hermanniensis]